MSAHAPTPGSSDDSFFNTPTTFLASSSTTSSNPLRAFEEIGNNIVKGTLGTVSAYIADILKPLKTAVDNIVAIPENGWTSAPRGVLGAVANVGRSFASVFTGIPHALDHSVTHTLNNSVVDLTAATTNRVPGVGNFAGNIARLGAGGVTAPFRFASWLTRMGPDALIDWINKIGLVEPPVRYLSTAYVSTGGHH